MRLDKYLVDCGVGSRSEVKQILKKKLITVNGRIEVSLKIQIDEGSDVITYRGEVLTHETFVYYLLYKPKGVISATEDSRHRTVLDLLDDTARHKKVFPVGRLDIDTTGLLLLTNDGDLAHSLLSPKKHVNKLYLAEVDGIMNTDDIAAFEAGISLKDFDCQPAKLEILETNDIEKTSLVRVNVQEGKYHQVKRMVASRGKTVTELKRLSMGPLTLPEDLSVGHWRRLTSGELASLTNR